ncbi:MAG: FkbM family methyltransferase [Candidatus Acidiferrales bacterium]|jgi:hypothetical protein
MRFSLRENRGLKSKLKSWLLPSGRSPRRIRFGLLGGLTMQMDLAHHSQRWLGLQERELCEWVRRFARDINTAVDVGANDGMYTLYFLARTSARKVYSFEPSTDCIRELEQNLALNDLAANERLKIDARMVGASIAQDWTTLDSLAASIVPPCLIKVDIDGGERDLLSGASRCLALPGMRWIIEVHSKALEQDCLRALTEVGYHVEIVPNAWWRNVIPELRPGELNHWLVAYRDEEK